MRAPCSIWSAFCLCLLLSSQSMSYCWLREKWQSAVENAKLGSWDRFLCSWKAKHKCWVDWRQLENAATEAHSYSLALDRRSHLPVLIQLEEGLVLSGAQHQEVDEQEHAKWIRVWIQTKNKKETRMTDYHLKFLIFRQLTNYRNCEICIFGTSTPETLRKWVLKCFVFFSSSFFNSKCGLIVLQHI